MRRRLHHRQHRCRWRLERHWCRNGLVFPHYGRCYVHGQQCSVERHGCGLYKLLSNHWLRYVHHVECGFERSDRNDLIQYGWRTLRQWNWRNTIDRSRDSSASACEPGRERSAHMAGTDHDRRWHGFYELRHQYGNRRVERQFSEPIAMLEPKSDIRRSRSDGVRNRIMQYN